ncbi:hypothetical protein CYMTET_53078 [Cymbomonas tetramitiformis]|uniref:Uncharacterized protein n=1 Tax=Cymbomonas tetramitiformis TaxID=36881 RepID=A0AAE0EQQ0_9CHLO|nr:hypothetical protein CYMTET_53078 [Cymbomonas tetramitiformis]
MFGLGYLLWGAGGLAGTYLVVLLVFQEKLVYVPSIPGMPREYPYTPRRLKMDYEDVEITAKDKTKIHGWFIRATERLVATQGKGPTVIFFQENAGNIAHRLQVREAVGKFERNRRTCQAA